MCNSTGHTAYNNRRKQDVEQYIFPCPCLGLLFAIQHICDFHNFTLSKIISHLSLTEKSQMAKKNKFSFSLFIFLQTKHPRSSQFFHSDFPASYYIPLPFQYSSWLYSIFFYARKQAKFAIVIISFKWNFSLFQKLIILHMLYTIYFYDKIQSRRSIKLVW